MAEYIFHLNYCFFAEGHKLPAGSEKPQQSTQPCLYKIWK